jgi:hypothetical protein
MCRNGEINALNEENNPINCGKQIFFIVKIYIFHKFDVFPLSK